MSHVMGNNIDGLLGMDRAHGKVAKGNLCINTLMILMIKIRISNHIQ